MEPAYFGLPYMHALLSPDVPVAGHRICVASVGRYVSRSVGRSHFWYHNILEDFKAFSIILCLNSHSHQILLKVIFCWPWIKVKVTVKVRLNWNLSAMSLNKLKLEALKLLCVSIMVRPRLSSKMGDLGLFLRSLRSLWKKGRKLNIFDVYEYSYTLQSKTRKI